MSKCDELADRLERMWGPHGLIKEAAAALRELEAERDALWMRCQNYRLGGARTGDEWDALIAERDTLREDLALAIHTISHQLDNIPKEMRRIAADRIAQFRETLARTKPEGKG